MASVKSVMDSLKECATPQNVRRYIKHGAKGEFFGVSAVNLYAISKRINKDTKLARQLWETKNLDAMMVATMIAQPVSIGGQQLDVWVKQIDFYPLADYFVRKLIVPSPYAKAKMRKWVKGKREYVQRCGYLLVAWLSMHDETLSDTEFSDYLVDIESSISGAANRAREAMNFAIIGIGRRNNALKKQALLTATRIGPIVIDHGRTGYKTPDAVVEIGRPNPRGWRLSNPARGGTRR